jgi:hypothetical protein
MNRVLWVALAWWVLGSTSPRADNAVPRELPGGHWCVRGRDCKSGRCEGRGCDAAHPGVCAPEGVKCPKDRVAYCGCNDKTFFASSACPGQRFKHDGYCAGDVDQSPLMPTP